MKYNSLIAALLLAFSFYICMYVAFDQSPILAEKNVKYILNFTVAFLFNLTWPHFMGRHIPRIIQEIFKKGKLNEKFKQIFDKLDETIIIIDK